MRVFDGPQDHIVRYSVYLDVAKDRPQHKKQASVGRMELFKDATLRGPPAPHLARVNPTLESTKVILFGSSTSLVAAVSYRVADHLFIRGKRRTTRIDGVGKTDKDQHQLLRHYSTILHRVKSRWAKASRASFNFPKQCGQVQTEPPRRRTPTDHFTYNT